MNISKIINLRYQLDIIQNSKNLLIIVGQAKFGSFRTIIHLLLNSLIDDRNILIILNLIFG